MRDASDCTRTEYGNFRESIGMLRMLREPPTSLQRSLEKVGYARPFGDPEMPILIGRRSGLVHIFSSILC